METNSKQISTVHEVIFLGKQRELHCHEEEFVGPPIKKDKTFVAVRKMKSGKATGPENASVQLSEVRDDYGIDKITTLLNKI